MTSVDGGKVPDGTGNGGMKSNRAERNESMAIEQKREEGDLNDLKDCSRRTDARMCAWNDNSLQEEMHAGKEFEESQHVSIARSIDDACESCDLETAVCLVLQAVVHEATLMVGGLAPSCKMGARGRDDAARVLLISETSVQSVQILQAALRACPVSTVHASWGLGGAVLQMIWPRRLGGGFRIMAACAKRLQGVMRRYETNSEHSLFRRSVLVVSWRLRMALCQRKFEQAKRREETRADMPRAMRRTLFLDRKSMDLWDKIVDDQWHEVFRGLESTYRQLRDATSMETHKRKELKDLIAYEDRLFNDLERGGGGGLVRALGGPAKARKKFGECQDALLQLKTQCMKLKEQVERCLREIKWAFTGGWDSLNSQELLVQDGQLRCTKDAHVTVASR